MKMVIVTEDEVTEEQNKTAFIKLIKFLNKRSLCLVNTGN